MRQSEHTADASNDTAHRPADDTTDEAPDRTGCATAGGRTVPGAAHNALRFRGSGDHECREEDGRDER